MKKILYIFLFLLSFLFYWNTGRQIENRTEAEDVFEYAVMVEQGTSHPWYFHQHHLLFGPVMKVSFEGASRLGYSGRAIDMMRLLSALAASGTLFFFFMFCYKRFSLRPVSSLIATAFLGLTYGFWRYSAESEIPLTASFYMVVALFFSTDPLPRKRSFILAVGFSCLAVLMHIMNAVAVFAAIPCFYLLKKRWSAAGLHIVLSAGVILGTYLWVSQYAVIFGGGGAHLIPLGLSSIFKGAIALVECVISCDFMLGFRSVRAFLGELFAGRMLLEEFYLGERLPRIHILLSTLTFALFNVLLIACVFRAGWVWKNIVADRKRLKLPDGMAAIAVAGIFFVGYAGLILFVEPGNPELWIMGLVPLTLLLCGLVLLPLTVDNRLWLPFLMVLILFIHNAGAMRMLQNPSMDYQQQKSKTILELADADDVIITAGNPVFERYLRYHFEGVIVYLHNLSAKEMDGLTFANGVDKVYVLDDVFNQPRSLQIRFPEKSDEIEQFSERIRSSTERVCEDEFGGVYLYQQGADEF